MQLLDPAGRQVEVQLEPRGDATQHYSYRPVTEGPHSVHVSFAGAPLPRSPFPVNVGPGRNPLGCWFGVRGTTKRGCGLRVRGTNIWWGGGCGVGVRDTIKVPAGWE